MKILHALYQCKTGAGALQVAVDLAEAARIRGHRVTVLTRNSPVFDQPGIHRFFTGHKAWDWWRLGQRIRRGSYDVVHVHDRYCSLLVSTIPQAPPSLQTNHLIYRTHRRLTRFADMVVACSRAMDRHHEEFFGLPASRRAWIPNGVPPHDPRQDQLPLLLHQLPAHLRRRRLCLTVARLVPQKGHQYLLDAIARLPVSLRSQWGFVWAGDGELRAALQQQANELGIGSDIHWLGASRQVAEWLALAEAFVLPSLYEGLPLSLLEAMAAGLPCLATAVDGNLDVLRPQENGLLCLPEDAASLASALHLLLADGQLRIRLGEQAHLDYQQEWTFERTWQQYESLYFKLSSSALSS